MNKDCVICGSKIPPHMTDEGVVYWEGGHNAEPYASGRCCDLCHDLLVIPFRFIESISSVIRGPDNVLSSICEKGLKS